MGFTVKKDTRWRRPVLVCDGPGCGRQIEDADLDNAAVVLAADGSCRFACGSACVTRLAGSDDDQYGLCDWWRAATAMLGFDAGDLELFDEPPPRGAGDVIDALPDLERLTKRPGLPAGLRPVDGLWLGYVHPMQVAEVLEASRP
jgi:hypothetical protein